MNRYDINNADDFREAIIGIVNYMAFYGNKVCTLSEPIEVEWGLMGISKYEGKKMILPTIALADRTEY